MWHAWSVNPLFYEGSPNSTHPNVCQSLLFSRLTCFWAYRAEWDFHFFPDMHWTLICGHRQQISALHQLDSPPSPPFSYYAFKSMGHRSCIQGRIRRCFRRLDNFWSVLKSFLVSLQGWLLMIVFTQPHLVFQDTLWSSKTSHDPPLLAWLVTHIFAGLANNISVLVMQLAEMRKEWAIFWSYTIWMFSQLAKSSEA